MSPRLRPHQTATRASSGICFLVGAALLGACLFPAAAGAAWSSPPTNLSDPGLGGQDPAIATGPDGTTTAVWRQYGYLSSIQVATRMPGSASFSAPATLGPIPNAGSPQVAIGPDGTTTVIWLQQTLSGKLLLLQATRPAGSSAFSIQSQLSEDAGAPEDARVALGPDGAAVVVWSDYQEITGEQVRMLFARVRPSASAPFGPVQIFSGNLVRGAPLSPSVVSYGPDGRATAAWIEPESGSGNNVLWTSTYSPETGYFSLPKRLSSVEREATMPDMESAPNGDTLIAWINRASPEAPRELEVATRPAGSNVFGSPEALAPNASASSPWPSYLTVGEDGAATVAWREYDGSDIKAATRPPGASTFSAPTTIAEGPNQHTPSADTGPSGDTIVTWQRGGETSNGVFASTRSSGGTSFSSPVQLGTAGLNELPELALASAGPCGGFNTALWRNWDGSIWSIQESSAPAARCVPNLAPLTVRGPAKVRKGKRATFEVEISNTGSAKARDLVVRATGKGASASPRSAGDLGAGKSKTIPIAVKFTSSGKVKLTLEVSSRNAGEVRKSLWVKVLG